MDLKRLLRNYDLGPLLETGMKLLEPGWGVAIVGTENVVACVGLSNHLHEISSVRFTSAFCCNERQVGTILIAPQGISHASEAAKSPQLVADFLAQSLELLLQQESARRALASDTLQKYRELSLLHRATVGLNTSLRLRDVGKALLAECQSGALPAEMGMIFLRDGDSEQADPFYSFGPTMDLEFEMIAKSVLFEGIMRGEKGEILNDLRQDPRWRDEVPGIRALLTAPLVAADRLVGALVLATTHPDGFEANHLQYVSTLTSVAGIAMGNAVHFEGVQTLMKALLQALATAIDARDPFTAGHSHRVARLAVALAKLVHDDTNYFHDVHYSSSDLAEIFYAGLLHDVGKIGIREQVLTKSSRLPEGQLALIGMRMALWSEVTGIPWQDDFERLKRINHSDVITRDDAALVTDLSKNELKAYGSCVPVLTTDEIGALLIARGNLLPEERQEIERHPTESFRILQHIPFPRNMNNLLSTITQHHERLDGSGYPTGLKAPEISLSARILMIVDIYDAVTMERHYKPALPREKALLVLEEEAGLGKLDKHLVDLLSSNIDDVEEDALDMAMHQDFDAILGKDAKA